MTVNRPITRPLLNAIVLAVALPLLLATGSGASRPPVPQPNPDRAFVTPFQGAGGATASPSSTKLCTRLRAQARKGNSHVGLQVRNLKTGRVVCGLNASGMRSLASNTKIFTTATALARMGPSHRFATRLFAVGRIDDKGTLHGNLYLKGGGDPALGTMDFLNRYLGGGGSAVERLATRLKARGIKRVTGRLFGDDTVFDRLRGVADSGYATSSWIGPLSGLSFNAGFTSSSLSYFSSDPAKLATRTLARSLRSKGIRIRPETGMKRTPATKDRTLVARILSPDVTWNARITNLNSNNFFAEMLVKNLGAEVRGSGTTRQGTIVVKRYAASEGVKVHPVDGSGLTRSNRSNATGVVRLLTRIRKRPWSDEFLASLPVAGRDGTLASRMRGTAAEGRCHAKTGTLTGVTALSGYCFNRSGHAYAFSILMNNVYDVYAARYAQDRIAAIVASL